MARTKRDAETVCVDNLSIAAALLTSGCTLQKMNRTSPGRVEFVIQGEDAELTVADYTLGRLEGNLRDYMRHFDDLRTLLRKGGVR